MANSRTVGSLVIQMRAEMGQLRTDVKQMEDTFKGGFSRVETTAKRLGGVIGASLGGAALVGFAKSVADVAGRISDLADQTGFSARVLSGMKSTLEEAGSSIDAFAKAVFVAQRNIGLIRTGSEESAIAAKALGLNFKELQTQHPEQFIETIGQALLKVENPLQRNSLGAALLGRSFQELAPIIGLVTGKFEEFRQAGMKEEDIAALDRFGDSLTRLSNAAQITASGPLGKLASIFEEEGFGIRQEVNRIIKDFDDLGAQLRSLSKLRFDFGSFKITGLEEFNKLREKRSGEKALEEALRREAIDAKDLLVTPSQAPLTFTPLISPTKTKKVKTAAEKLVEDIKSRPPMLLKKAKASHLPKSSTRKRRKNSRSPWANRCGAPVKNSRPTLSRCVYHLRHFRKGPAAPSIP